MLILDSPVAGVREKKLVSLWIFSVSMLNLINC